MRAFTQLQVLILHLAGAVVLPCCAHGAEAAGDELAPPFKLDLDEQSSQTAVGFSHKGPPPWPEGNCVDYGQWNLVNMHAENLTAFRRKSGVRFLTVRPIDRWQVLVIDDRVGREWLRYGPCEHCASLQQRLEWPARYRKHFRPLPEAEALVGTVWELIDRQDTDAAARPDIIEAILPGNRLQFRERAVLRIGATDEATAERAWLIKKHGEGTTILTIYDVDDTTGEYKAIRFQAQKLDDEMHLIPCSRIDADDQGVGQSRLSGPRETKPQLYRLVSRP